MEELDEKGFVFIGADGKPYLCRMWGGNAWFMYWNNDLWVSLKKVTQTEVWQASDQKAPDEAQKYYFDKNEAMLKQF